MSTNIPLLFGEEVRGANAEAKHTMKRGETLKKVCTKWACAQ